MSSRAIDLPLFFNALQGLKTGVPSNAVSGVVSAGLKRDVCGQLPGCPKRASAVHYQAAAAVVMAAATKFARDYNDGPAIARFYLIRLKSEFLRASVWQVRKYEGSS